MTGGSGYSTILQYEDLLSCGLQGLLEAHRTYDCDRGVKFSTYALPRIRGAILDALRAAHPLPRSLQKVSSDIERTVSSLYGDLGRTPTKPEVAERLGVPLQELLSVSQAASIRVLSLEGLADINTNGHWNSASSVGRTRSGFGCPEVRLTFVRVSSESRIDMLMSARGKSVRQLPPVPVGDGSYTRRQK